MASELVNGLVALLEGRPFDPRPITAAVLYVDASGSDTTGDGTAARPFRQIQRALEYLEDYSIETHVTISVGAGSFAAFVVDLTRLHMPRGSLVVPDTTRLEIVGTLATATPATGSATGTVTASSAAQGAITVTDAAQTWTSNDLRGKYIRFNSGALSGFAYPIEGNTATDLTVRMSSASALGVTYTIVSHATVIDSGAVYGIDNINPYRVVAQGADMPASSNLTIRSLRLSLDGASGARLSTRCTFRECVLVRTTGTTGAVAVVGPATLVACWSQLHGSSGTHVAHSNGSGSVQHANVVCVGGATGIMPFSWSGPVYLTGWTFDTVGTGVSVTGTAVNLSGPVRAIGCTAAIAVATAYPTAPASVSSTATVAHYFSGCGTVLSLTGPAATASVGACSGTGNTTGVSMSKGARVQVPAAAALGATSEVVIDGTVITLADMRALSPRVYPAVASPYGTAVYE